MIIISTAEITPTAIKKGWIKMFHKIEKKELNPRIGKLFERETEVIIEVPGKDKERIAFLCDSFQTQNGTTFVFGIEQERTDAGRGMVRGLWFEEPVIVWAEKENIRYRIEARPYRCHIVGPVFSHVLDNARQKNPAKDISAVWELLPEECRETAEKPPEPTQQIVEGEPEYHLDYAIKIIK